MTRAHFQARRQGPAPKWPPSARPLSKSDGVPAARIHPVARPSFAGRARDLRHQENSAGHSARVDAIERSLLENRPPADAPLFTALAASRTAMVSMNLPGGGMALALFSDPVRAADYCDVLLGGNGAPGTATLSALGLLEFMHSNHRAFGGQLSLDRCPRCEVFGVSTIGPSSTVDSVLTLWAGTKAQERARLELYLEHATVAANAGDWLQVKDIALETIGHVSPVDPRLHTLVGRAAYDLGDQTLFDEAKQFLLFLAWMSDAQSGLRAADKAGHSGTALPPPSPTSAMTRALKPRQPAS
jgi:hypothetical protein